MLLAVSRRLVLGIALASLGLATIAAGYKKGPKHLLVVTVTKGFRHGDSIDVGEKIVADLGTKDNSFVVDYARTDEDLTQKMSPEGLKQYDGVFFLNTTGDLPLPDRDAFIKWVEAGHGFIGTHSATDTFHGYPPYLDMIGAEFKTHGAQVEVNCLVTDKKHPATKMLGDSFKVFDEIYQFQRFDRARFHDLLHLDKHPNEGTPGYYPLCWCRKQGKGRVFYTALGHRPDVWQSAWYQAHLLGGIRWALGLAKGDANPQTVPVNGNIAR